MQELIHRLCQEGDLNKERNKFQAQLAKYEKYAALTQRALGAALRSPPTARLAAVPSKST